MLLQIQNKCILLVQNIYKFQILKGLSHEIDFENVDED